MKRKKSGNHWHSYVKYSNLAFQILAVFLLAVFGGYKLDTNTAYKFPFFTLAFSILAIIIVFVISIKDFTKK